MTLLLTPNAHRQRQGTLGVAHQSQAAGNGPARLVGAACKVSFAHDQLGAASFVKLEVKADFPGRHLALSRVYFCHFGDHISHLNSELAGAVHQLGHFRAMNDVLARQAGDIRTRSSD